MRQNYPTNTRLSDKTICNCWIMSSDEDQPIVEDILAGLTMRGELLIVIEHTDYEAPEYNCYTFAAVNYDNASRLARKLKVRLHELPKFISDNMKEWREITVPSLRQASDCFKDITEHLLDEGCHFKIKRSTGHNGYICC